MNGSAQKRPRFGVEEIAPMAAGSTIVSDSPPPINLSDQPTVVETIPPIPYFDQDRPPEVDQSALPVALPPTVSGPVPSNVPPVSTSNLPPNGHNVMGKSHPARKALFLVPAVLVVATIFLVARFTGDKFTIREPAPVPTALPTDAPIVENTPNPRPTETKKYTNKSMLIEMKVPKDYEILFEDESSVSFGRDGKEILVVRTDEFTNYDEKDDALDVLVGGRDGVEFTLKDESSSPVRIVQTTDTPKYEFVMYLDDSDLSVEFQKILDSVVFLVDASTWKTFESSYGYKINYPEDWVEFTQTTAQGLVSSTTRISKDEENNSLYSLVVKVSTNEENAALSASEIISSTRTLSGWTKPPKIELKKLGGGDAQIIQGELSGKWRGYVVVWYRNTIVQMVWDDSPQKPYQEVFEEMLSSFEFTI